MCEAMIAAYEATEKQYFLNRAKRLAQSVMFTLLPQFGELIWEHYHENWEIDWKYNKWNTKDETSPFGFIFGHSFEWCKLLLMLDQYAAEEWHVPYAERLFRYATMKGVDLTYGGIFFSMGPDGKLIDTDKSYWVMAEAIGASAQLLSKRGQPEYQKWYTTMFNYCWQFLIDHQHGGWYQWLDRRNRRYSNVKSPPPKMDYHPVTNCYLTILAFELASKGRLDE
jgi:mannose/cellobiose epimerase-like protein (N-acyl-D-glucosamine 2-epimerase family)